MRCHFQQPRWACIGFALALLVAVSGSHQVGAQADLRSAVEDLILGERFREAAVRAKQWLADQPHRVRVLDAPRGQ